MYGYYRSSRPEVFCEKGVLKNFAKFTGNTCARVSFLIKLQAFSTPFLTEHLCWLLLLLQQYSSDMFCEKDLKSFTKFIVKHLCWNNIERWLQHRYYVNFEKFLRTFHFEEQQVAASVTIYFKRGMDNANITFSHSRFLEFSFSSVTVWKLCKYLF